MCLLGFHFSLDPFHLFLFRDTRRSVARLQARKIQFPVEGLTSSHQIPRFSSRVTQLVVTAAFLCLLVHVPVLREHQFQKHLKRQHDLPPAVLCPVTNQRHWNIVGDESAVSGYLQTTTLRPSSISLHASTAGGHSSSQRQTEGVWVSRSCAYKQSALSK